VGPSRNDAAAATDSYLQPLPLGLHHVTRAMNALGTLWIVALMVLINTDVFGRNFLNAPILGVPELVSLSIVGIVFLQLADTLRCGRFTRAEILLDWLTRKHPALADALHVLYHLIGAALMLAILWAAWAPLVESLRIFEYVGAVGSFQAPVWPIRLIMLVGLGMTVLCFLLLAWCDVRRLLGRLNNSSGRAHG
jgi:TRAP-type mannitol/chloroaromatic compound transport system permease small subunit